MLGGLMLMTPWVAGASDTPLTCTLALAPRSVVGQPVMLTFTLHNRGTQALAVLEWGTPLEGARSDAFEITGPRGRVAYTGPMLKRGDPGVAAYHRIEPGQTLTATLDLASVYDLSRPGSYRLRWQGHLHDVVALPAPLPRLRDSFSPHALTCPARRWSQHSKDR
jgi:hypothetical protein